MAMIPINKDDELDFRFACHSIHAINSKGLWVGDDPFMYSVPILLFQLSLVSIITRCIYVLLKPLGQPFIISQILGGVLLGPSMLGYNSAFTTKFFPERSRVVLETLSVFGFMFIIFLIGVKTDPTIILKSGKRAFTIGILGFFVPYVLSALVALLLNGVLSLDEDMFSFLPMVVSIHSMTPFPVIAYFLADLEILNSEIGRLASSSSIISDLCFWLYMTLSYTVHIATEKSLSTSIESFLCTAIFILLVCFGIHSAALWVIQRTPEGKPVKERYFFSVLIALLGCGLTGQVIGLNAFIVPFIVGLVIPDGPPLGAALVEKLDCFVSVILTPVFFIICGLKTDVFAIQKFKNVVVILSIAVVAVFGKILGTVVPPLICRMPLRDALSLGLIMSSKGLVELALLSSLNTVNVVSDECFTIVIISVVVVTVVVSPLVKALYDPSKRYLAYKRRTIRHLHGNEEFRILACVQTQEQVPAIITLLEASNPTKEHPIHLFVLHLVKLSARASSLLIAYLPQEKPFHQLCQSARIFKVFTKFEQENQSHLTLHCYKGISPYETMHNDVCSLALEQRTTFIIIPYKNVNRHLNKNVLDKAPCSVGVLIESRNQESVPYIVGQGSWFRVAVLFFGGADDREALAYAKRMLENPTVNVTLFLFSFSSEVLGGSSRRKLLDAEILIEFRRDATDSERVSCQEQTLIDVAGLKAAIRSLENAFDLVLVGKHHAESQLNCELRKWNNRGELGAIGEMLAASDFNGGPSVLVIQQQTRVWGLRDPDVSLRLRRVKL
ncbi:hypothetical protein QYF36_005258 [Acer negundo]|nr:hypothetical protein QYF36_005258 [Acer negundo]